MARFKRRRKYIWLPHLGGVAAQTEPSVFNAWFSTTLDVQPNITCGIIAPVADHVQERVPSDENVEGMGELVGNEYFLKRIVGKIWCNHELSAATVAPDTFNAPDLEAVATIASVGIFVARADNPDDGVPIGVAATGNTIPAYTTLARDTTREPWIWRRSWILGWSTILNQFNLGRQIQLGANAAQVLAGYNVSGVRNSGPGSSFPESNALHGSALDGPHIDAKTARRIGQDDRLYIAFSTQSYPEGQQSLENAEKYVRFGVDLRFLGQLRRPRSSGKF